MATDIFKGVVAGFGATFVVSALMVAQTALGIFSQVDMIHLLSAALGTPDGPGAAWVLHFVIGSLAWGSLFAWIEPRLSGISHTRRGIFFGVLAWLVMMLLFMPATGGGLFGLQFTALVPIVTLVLHVIYGTVLGWAYGRLAPTRDPFARHGHRAV